MSYRPMSYKVILVAACLVTELAVPVWSAQQGSPNATELRTVEGTVLFAARAVRSPAVVYLYDDRTQSVRTYFVDKAGHYRFCGLYPFDDYQIYARRGRMTSKIRSISSRDGHTNFIVNLRIPQGG